MLEKHDKVRDYTLVKFLGKGQFGEVWLAEKRLEFANRTFRHALKFLSNIGNEIDLKIAEAEIDTWIEASGHPNVMSVLDMFAHQNYFIIVSEFAEGGSLRGWLERSGGRAATLDGAMAMIGGILSGIEHLHSRNVVHRDLKPDNILLQGSFPRIADFGISRIVSSNSLLTNVVGSPAYMSPESFDGIKSTQTDIWSAGVIIYEMLTGRLPYEADTVFGLAAAIRYEDPEPLPADLPLPMRIFVGKALQKDLKKRFQSAAEMRADFEEVCLEIKIRSQSRLGSGNLGKQLDACDPFAITEAIDPPVLTGSDFEPLNTSGLDADSRRADPSALGKDTQLATGEATGHVGRFGINLETGPQPSVALSSKTLREPLLKSRKSRKVALIGTSVAGGLFLALVGGAIGAAMFYRSFWSNGAGGIFPSPAPAQASLPCDGLKEKPPDMVCINGGEFTMGRDGSPNPDESPAHNESVGPYIIDVYEVTNEQYAKFVTDTHRQQLPQGWSHGAYPPGQGNRPVVGVNWQDALDYATWAGKRLPTEAEWELAARGFDRRLYPWGDDDRSKRANVDNAKGSTTNVAEFPDGKSPFGLYNMVGNAAEWTSSDFLPYKGGNTQAPSGLKTVRGGAYITKKGVATATYRIGYPPQQGPEGYDLMGFRCAMDVQKAGAK